MTGLNIGVLYIVRFTQLSSGKQ